MDSIYFSLVLPVSLKTINRIAVQKVMEITDGNMSETARQLGVSYQTVRNYMGKKNGRSNAGAKSTKQQGRKATTGSDKCCSGPKQKGDRSSTPVRAILRKGVWRTPSV